MTTAQISHAAEATEESIFQYLCRCREEGDIPADASDLALRRKATEMKANLSSLSSMVHDTERQGGEVVFLGTEEEFASAGQPGLGILMMNAVARPDTPNQGGGTPCGSVVTMRAAGTCVSHRHRSCVTCAVLFCAWIAWRITCRVFARVGNFFFGRQVAAAAVT